MSADDRGNPEQIYDVAVIGYGPCGGVLTSTLAHGGHDVIVIERFHHAYPLPRMVSFDGEACRTVQATTKDVDAALRNSSVIDEFPYLAADGERLMVLDVRGEECGFPSRLSVFQPEIEAALDDSITDLPNATVARGTELLDLEQFDDHVRLTVRDFRSPGAPRRQLRARYVVGADGTGSKVREVAQLPVYDYGFTSAILNFDTIVKRPLPEHFSKFAAFMDPERVHMYMPIGTERERFEFYVLPGEDSADLEQPAVAWDFLREKHGLTPDDIEITRQIVYSFAARMAQQWRKGRIFVAGDAAHSMPPSLGQGGCSAIRDARNLAWKLGLVLDGTAPESLLDTYEAELRPFITWMVETATEIARMATTRSAEQAEVRNANLRATLDEPQEEWPWLQHGVLSEDRASGAVGRLAPQGRLRRGGFDGRGDDLLGSGFQLVSTRPVDLTAEQLEFLQRIHCQVAVLSDDPTAEHAAEDIDGVYSAFLSEHGADAYIMRPDWYVFSAGSAEAIPASIEELRALLGIRQPVIAA